MSKPSLACDVCGRPTSDGSSRRRVDGEPLVLCGFHAALLDQMIVATRAEALARLAEVPADRRSDPDRRAARDRRMFPPRPELRRASHGRREADPKL